MKIPFMKWGLAALAGVGLALWQSGLFSFSELGHQFQGVEKPKVVLNDVSANLQEVSTVQAQDDNIGTSRSDSDDMDVASTVPEVSKLLNEVKSLLDAVAQSDVPNESISPSNISAGSESSSTETRIEYDAKRAAIAKEGLEKILSFLSDAEGEEKLAAITALWRYVGDVSGDVGVPEEVLIALDMAQHDANSRVANEAKKALGDLQKLKNTLAGQQEDVELALQPPVPPISMNTPGSGPTTDGMNDEEYQKQLAEYEAKVQQREMATVQGIMEKLSSTTDENERSEILQDLSLHRSNASVEAWLELANDVDANVRYEAVNNLWRSGGDGLASDGKIISILQQAVWDRDESVAELARRALADLKTPKKAEEDSVIVTDPTSEPANEAIPVPVP